MQDNEMMQSIRFPLIVVKTEVRKEKGEKARIGYKKVMILLSLCKPSRLFSVNGKKGNNHVAMDIWKSHTCESFPDQVLPNVGHIQEEQCRLKPFSKL